MHPYNFGTSGNILMKLFQPMCRETGVITCVQFLEGPPVKFGRVKKRRNFCAISDELSTLMVNISGMCGHIKNLKSI